MRPGSDQSPGHDDERAFSAQISTAIFWDFSDLPLSNQPFKKLGGQMALRGVAVEAFGDETKLSKLADGTSRPGESSGRKRNTMFNVLPDNWVLRFFQKEGRGDLSAWCLRFVVDQTNPHSSLENRGTQFIDYEGTQGVGWANDLFRMTGIAAAVADKEIAYNGAGFLGMLYPDGKGGAVPVHYAMATEISRNLGHVATKKGVAQFAHILTLFEKAEGGGTRAEKKSQGGRPTKKKELGLLHRTGFKLPDGSGVTMPQIEAGVATSPDGSKKYKVHFTKGAKNPQKPDLDLNDLSNFEAIEVTPHEMLDGYVAVDPGDPYKPYETGDHSSHDESRHDYSYHGTGTGGNGGSSGGSPVSSGGTYSGDQGLGQDNTGSKAPEAEEANPGGEQGDPQKDAKLIKPGLGGFKEYWDNEAGAYKPLLDSNGQTIPN